MQSYNASHSYLIFMTYAGGAGFTSSQGRATPLRIIFDHTSLLVIRVDHHMKFPWIAGCRKDDDTGSTHARHRLPSN